MKRFNKKAYPLLAGKKVSDGKQIAVWCPYCKTHHLHGWGDDVKDQDVSERGAHCDNPDSPFYRKVYYITVEPSLKY